MSRDQKKQTLKFVYVIYGSSLRLSPKSSCMAPPLPLHIFTLFANLCQIPPTSFVPKEMRTFRRFARIE